MKKLLVVAAALAVVAVPYAASSAVDARCMTARSLLTSALSLTESLERDLYAAGLVEDANLLSAFRYSVEQRLELPGLSC